MNGWKDDSKLKKQSMLYSEKLGFQQMIIVELCGKSCQRFLADPWDGIYFSFQFWSLWMTEGQWKSAIHIIGGRWQCRSIDCKEQNLSYPSSKVPDGKEESGNSAFIKLCVKHKGEIFWWLSWGLHGMGIQQQWVQDYWLWVALKYSQVITRIVYFRVSRVLKQSELCAYFGKNIAKGTTDPRVEFILSK